MKFIGYYRVSTDKQGDSGLGLESQRTTVSSYLNSVGGVLLDEFTEVESAKTSSRPELLKAIKRCRVQNATLLVSKLDRLTRENGFIASLKKSGVKFIVAESPDLTNLTASILESVASHERELISQRTKSALQAAKQRGVVLGNPNLADVRNEDTTNANAARTAKAKEYADMMYEVIDDIISKSEPKPSLRAIASTLNDRGFTTRQGSKWNASTVGRVIKKCG